MPHDEYPDEVEDPRLVIVELGGVVRRQRLLLVLCVLIIMAIYIYGCEY